jgi:hypothetical protein
MSARQEPSPGGTRRDTDVTTLVQFYVDHFVDGDTPFARAFLDGRNLLQIQAELTRQLRRRTRNEGVPVVQFSDAILSALMTFAFRYRATPVNGTRVGDASTIFADQLADQNEARYFESAFWRRWCSQGLPDPNNIPLPLAPDFTDYTVETDAYMLSNPNGGRIPMW